jgi:iduronate 2-sulfatase
MRAVRFLPFLLTILCVSAPLRETFSAEKPNVLLILVDDLKPALGCYGDETALTPNIDALAARGMRFDLAYCNQAVCAPSRFTLMLGSHSTSTGLYGLGSPLRQILPDAVTMPQHFEKHGYRTESLGKIFHIGHGNLGDPESFSVPHFKEKVIEYVDPASKPDGKITREEAMFQNLPAPPGGMNSLARGAAFESPAVEDNAYADGRVADETKRRLAAAKVRREKDGTPFFIAAGFARPHLPFSAPKKYWDVYDPDNLPMPKFEDLPEGSPQVAGKRGGEIRNYFPVPDKNDPAQIPDDVKRQLIHGYYASTSYVDAQIGKVIDELDRLGLAENTIVVLWGDHGFHLGDLGIWTKHTNYEQANRIPILITAPGVTKPNSSTKQLAESVDVFPTLAELAGLPAPTGPQPIDGISLVPVLHDPSARVRDHAFHAYPKAKMGRAIRTERYRLVEWKTPGEDAVEAELELYDYQSDPDETKNLASESPQVIAQLHTILASYPEAITRLKGNSKGKKEASVKNPTPPTDNSPKINNQTLRIITESKTSREAGMPVGVVLAQGGREHGYAIHFLADGRAAFDVRINGVVTRIAGEKPVPGEARLEAELDEQAMVLSLNGHEIARAKSPGLIPAQPKDPLSIGQDVLSAAGDYELPNPYNGTVINTRVEAGGKPAAIAKPMSRNEIETGFQSHDRALFVHNAWIRDPYLVQGPDKFFYLTGTTPVEGDPREQSDPYNSGLGTESLVGWHANVWRSRNLIEWQSLGAPFTLKDGIWYSENREAFENTDQKQWRLWAPELHWIDAQQKWALVHTSPSPVKGANLSLSAGPEFGGPWSNPMGAAITRKHDPSLFQDDDGSWWMIWGATTIAPLKADFSAFAGEPVAIHPAPASDGTTNGLKMGHEGCLIMKIEGKYVLFGTGWSTGKMRRGSYNLYYATADEITGPYSERKFAGRFLGHGTPFQDREERWWCTAFYNANVPPDSRDGIEARDIGDTARTINQRGTTLVPLDVRLPENGELHIRAKDPAYAAPGPDEAQQFDR